MIQKKQKYLKELKKLKENIIEQYKPEKIILFGSLAWGKFGPDSDIDLFVVKNTKKEFFERFDDFIDKVDTNVKASKDIIIFTPAEIKKRIKIKDDFILDIVNKGKVLYEKR